MKQSVGKVPTVSIIIPVYNVEKYLCRCVDSILTQSFSDFELIMIDDGSRDNSGKICDEYALKDTRIIILHNANQGAAAARNAGLDKASGKYVSFIDSDDYINPVFLEQMVSALESDHTDLVMCDISLTVNSKSQQIIKCKFPNNTTVVGREEVLKNIVQYKCNGYSPLWNKLYKRNIIEQHNLRIPLNLSFGEDLIFNILYFKECSTIKYINAPLYYYEQTESGLYKKYRLDYLSDCMLCRGYMLEYLREYESYDKGFIRINKKFLSDIERVLSQIYEHEATPRKVVATWYKNPGVIDCMRQLLDRYTSGDTTALTDVAQVRIAKLVAGRHANIAVAYTDYLNNPRNFLRRIMERFRLVKELTKDNNLCKIKSYLLSKYQSKKGGRVKIGKNTKSIIEGRLDIKGELYFNRCHDGINNQPGTLYVSKKGKLEVSGGFMVYSGGYMTVASGATLILGSGFINNNGKISCFNRIEIGDDVKISEDVTIRDSDNHTIVRDGYEVSQPIKIGNHVWIGLGVTILKGVTIGDGAVIAAGAVVTKSIPPKSLAAGVPAKVIKSNIKWE